MIQLSFMDDATTDGLTRALALHRRAVVIDTHCDTPQRLLDPEWRLERHNETGHVDLPRMRAGGLDAAFFAVWAPEPATTGEGRNAARRQIDRIRQSVTENQEHVVLARTAAEITRAKAEDKIALLIAIEGGYLIEDSLEVLHEYHEAGATYLTLTHGFHTSWADSSGIYEALSPRHNGLTDFGREIIQELNRLGMMVDVAHAHDRTVRDVLETSVAPVLATHSACRDLVPHPRNLSDELLREIAATGGTVQINFCPAMIDRTFPAMNREDLVSFQAAGGKVDRPVTDHITPLELLVDHFDHAIQLLGPDHVGIGSDFDGVAALPAGMEDCSKLPHLTAALLRRGYTEADLTRVLGGNVLRVMEACRQTASRIQGADLCVSGAPLDLKSM